MKFTLNNRQTNISVQTSVLSSYANWVQMFHEPKSLSTFSSIASKCSRASSKSWHTVCILKIWSNYEWIKDSSVIPLFTQKTDSKIQITNSDAETRGLVFYPFLIGSNWEIHIALHFTIIVMLNFQVTTLFTTLPSKLTEQPLVRAWPWSCLEKVEVFGGQPSCVCIC